jgi:hypothetical protein
MPTIALWHDGALRAAQRWSAMGRLAMAVPLSACCAHSLRRREIGAGWQAGGGEGSACRVALGREEQAQAPAVEEPLHLRPEKRWVQE